jgi:hypothetical protein
VEQLPHIFWVASTLSPILRDQGRRARVSEERGVRVSAGAELPALPNRVIAAKDGRSLVKASGKAAERRSCRPL